MIHVLQLISSNGLFGAENVLIQLARELNGNRNFRTVVGIIKNLYNPHEELVPLCRQSEIETAIFPCRGKFDIGTVRQLRQFATERSIDIIHTHGYKSNLYSYLSSLGLPVRRISTCHNWLDENFKMKGYAILDRMVLRKFDRISAVSNEVREKIVQSGIAPEKVVKIVNGIRLDPFTRDGAAAESRKMFGIGEDDLVIGMAGRLSPEKNHRSILSLAGGIIRRFPNSRFLIAGDGPLKEELMRDFSSRQFIFAGFRTDMNRLYACMDIFVLPSLTEGLPIVLLEAMASGLPVAATRVGDIPDVVLDGETGLLADPDRPAELAEKVIRLLSDRSAAREMGRKGRVRVEGQYRAEQMGGAYRKLYETVQKGE